MATQGSDGSAAKPEISSGPRLDVPFAAVKQGVTTRWAWGVFGILFLVHLLESVDRWLLPAVLRPVSEELALTDAQAGWLATVLLISHAVWAPVVGYLADRLRRPRLMAIGIAVWSLATVGTGLARSYTEAQMARAACGRRRIDVRGHRPHDPDGPLPAGSAGASALGLLSRHAHRRRAGTLGRLGHRTGRDVAHGVSGSGGSRPGFGPVRAGSARPSAGHERRDRGTSTAAARASRPKSRRLRRSDGQLLLHVFRLWTGFLHVCHRRADRLAADVSGRHARSALGDARTSGWP